MPESVVLTKSSGGDFQIVTTGQYEETRQFAVANYSTTATGVKLHAPEGMPELMKKRYLPSEWTVDGVSNFTTNKQVTDAITALNNA